MTWQEIYNIIIASVPALTAILTVLTLAIKLISSLTIIKKSFETNTETTQATIDELKANNAALQEMIITTQNQLSDLGHSVNKIIDKVDTSV